jgi:hypothetical protein
MRDKLSETRNANIKFKMRVFTVHIACLHKLSTFSCKISTILKLILPLDEQSPDFMLLADKTATGSDISLDIQLSCLPVVCLDVMFAL